MTSDHGADREGPGFHELLRRHRLHATLTQQELAARAAVGVRTLRDLEHGRASRPQRTTVELLADALGLTGAPRGEFLAAARGRAARPPGSSLPAAPDLIGRDAELAELADALGADGRPAVVTLVGLAGVGKTSLALAVAHRVAAAYPGGTAGILVTEAGSADDLLAAAAAGFGGGRFADLAGGLAGRPGLLLVDAVERAPEAVAEAVSRIREQVPTLRILATGRHPVGLAAEHVWPLAPLLAPPADAAGAPADVSGYPAVALLLDRLARVRRTPVTADEMAPLVALVRRLGGLPLAIELAAARGRVLTVAEILDRYGDRVLDLSGAPGSADTLSLRDAVAASYRLLDPDEQYLLRQLAVFRHRFSLALAERMVQDALPPGTDLVHLLDRLLELGLVGVRGTTESRFRLLDVVRDYATERAATAGELAAGRRRHAAALAEVAERAAPDLAGPRSGEAAGRLDDIAGDLGAALAYAAREDPHTALRLAAALPRWWRFRGQDVTGRRTLRRLLADPRTADADPVARAWAKLGLAELTSEPGTAAEDRAVAESALADFTRLADPAGQAAAHARLAVLLKVTGGAETARRHAEAAVTLARAGGRLRDVAVADTRRRNTAPVSRRSRTDRTRHDP